MRIEDDEARLAGGGFGFGCRQGLQGCEQGLRYAAAGFDQGLQDFRAGLDCGGDGPGFGGEAAVGCHLRSQPVEAARLGYVGLSKGWGNAR